MFKITFTIGDLIALGTFLIIIFSLIMDLYRKVDRNGSKGGNNKEDILELKAFYDKLDDKLEEKVKEIYANSNLKYAEIFTEISHLRTDLRKLPLEIVKLMNETKK